MDGLVLWYCGYCNSRISPPVAHNVFHNIQVTILRIQYIRRKLLPWFPSPHAKKWERGERGKKEGFCCRRRLVGYWIDRWVGSTNGWILVSSSFLFFEESSVSPSPSPPPPPTKLGPQALPSISQKRKKGEKFSSASIPALICSTTDDFPLEIS